MTENVFSLPCNVGSGVPQGSVLGPLLFILYVNDAVDICNNDVEMALYADDLKLYSSVCSGSSSAVQNALDNLVKWANEWQLTINIAKCHVLKIGGKVTQTSYTIDGTTLPTSSSISDLGVIVDNKLSFIQHINSIVSKSNHRIGMFFRGFTSRNVKLASKFFSIYVRPMLNIIVLCGILRLNI